MTRGSVAAVLVTRVDDEDCVFAGVLNILDAGALRATFFSHSFDKETERRLGDRDQVIAFLDVDIDFTEALFTEVRYLDFEFGVANPVDLRSFFLFVTYFGEKAPLAWTLMEAFALDDH